MNSIQIIEHIKTMIHEDDIRVRHFLQNYDMLPIIEEFLKNQNFLKERINILSENPLWDKFMYIVYANLNTIYENIRYETIARILVLSEMVLKNEI